LIIRRLLNNERVLVTNVISDPAPTGDDELLQVQSPQNQRLSLLLPCSGHDVLIDVFSQLHPNMED
jgi:hypothetical protein